MCLGGHSQTPWSREGFPEEGTFNLEWKVNILGRKNGRKRPIGVECALLGKRGPVVGEGLEQKLGPDVKGFHRPC